MPDRPITQTPSEPSDTRSRPNRRHIVLLVVGFGVLYAFTANWGLTANVDAIAAALPAWSIATDGTPYLEEFASANPWMEETPDGWLSNRAPGVIAVGISGYLVSQPEVFTNVPATATAIAMTTAALVVLYVTLCRLVAPRTALIAAVLLGAGTSTWQVSADALWPHGPGQLWAALALLGLSSTAYARTGWALAAALVTRPLTAVSTAVIGLAEGWRERSIRPVLQVGIPAGVGLGALLLYNRHLFGTVSISGGYPAAFAERLTDFPVADQLANVVGFFFSLYNGIFIWSPVVLVGVVGLIGVWKTVPGWARSSAIAGLVYIVVHARLNRVSGGIPFGYRYPLEALMLSAPALTLGVRHLWTLGRIGRPLTIAAAGLSVLFQLALVFLLECHDIGTDMAPCSFTGLD